MEPVNGNPRTQITAVTHWQLKGRSCPGQEFGKGGQSWASRAAQFGLRPYPVREGSLSAIPSRKTVPTTML